jgi:hypothetical protein
MRQILPVKRFAIFIAALLLLGPVEYSRGQIPGSSDAVNTALLKLFGKNNNFTVRAEFTMFDATQQQLMSVAANMAVSDGRMRAEVDMATIKSKMISPEMIAQQKAAGLDRAISIMRPDKRKLYLIYPGLKAYAETPLPAAVAESSGQPPILKKTAVGHQTSNGHPCIKNKVVLADEQGRQQEIVDWEATDMKNFPVQVQLAENGVAILVRNSDVRFSKPDSKQFEPPPGYTRYDDVPTMLAQAKSNRPVK